jgi:hypothetical protein
MKIPWRINCVWNHTILDIKENSMQEVKAYLNLSITNVKRSYDT